MRSQRIEFSESQESVWLVLVGFIVIRISRAGIVAGLAKLGAKGVLGRLKTLRAKEKAPAKPGLEDCQQRYP
jgi:hypothetical protein